MSNNNKTQMLAVLPTGDWSFVGGPSDVSFYLVDDEGADDILTGKMIVDAEDLKKLKAKRVHGKPLEQISQL